ncbi:hypothetical protein TWF718_008508 [Orbilia javanica]|uniref:Uncharacterized protein n=1 Tax=Orbilia javanica TaxID=47235 RepID=A0AAN8RHR0_9PEZI
MAAVNVRADKDSSSTSLYPSPDSLPDSNTRSSAPVRAKFTPPPPALSLELFPERLGGYTAYQWAMTREPPLVIPPDNSVQTVLKSLCNAYPSYVPAQTTYNRVCTRYVRRSREVEHGYRRNHSQNPGETCGQELAVESKYEGSNPRASEKNMGFRDNHSHEENLLQEIEPATFPGEKPLSGSTIASDVESLDVSLRL